MRCNRIVPVLLVVVCLLLSACATKYGIKKSAGGFSEEELGDGIYLVTFEGNNRTPMEKVKFYNLFRCAEITLDKGYDYFLIQSFNNYRGTFLAYCKNCAGSTWVNDFEGPISKMSIKLYRTGVEDMPDQAIAARDFVEKWRQGLTSEKFLAVDGYLQGLGYEF